MESITPHYSSLDFLKFPDIVKLNTCMLFYNYFHHDKFPNLHVSLVSELHNYIQYPQCIIQPSCNIFIFELILGDFAPALLEVSFGMIFCNPLETNHPKNVQQSTNTLVPCSLLMKTLSLHNFLSYFVIFALLFPFLFLFIKYLKLYIT